MRLSFQLICFIAAISVSAEVHSQPVRVELDNVVFSCSDKHPRLLFSDDEFKQIRRTVNSCNNLVLQRLHNTYMEYADECVEKGKEIEYVPNGSGKILKVSRDVLGQIGACAYAYRITKDPKYSDRVESILNDVCRFETWHPQHYLDVSEMTLAVAVGYDWCYARLKQSTRSLCEKAVADFSFATAQDKHWRKKFRNGTNWGQVLNAGLIASSIAFYDSNPDLAKGLIKRAIKDNADYVSKNYAPDGISPEGPGYWGYGTSMQMILNSALEHSFGTDFGLSGCAGFEKSAKFITFATGTSGEVFNYSDGSIKKSQPALWYFAHKFKNPGLAYNEMKFIGDNPNYKMRLRFGFVYIPYATKVLTASNEPPTEKIFSGQGSNPMMMARTGWDKNDLYVGAKGGGAKNNHAHLDAGSFVFDAYGARWICEPDAPKYEKTEKALRSVGKSLWAMDQESMRWKVYGYNNLQHNTITINGQDHQVTGKGELEAVYDTDERRGALFDLSSLFSGQVDSVKRKICIIGGNELEIVDYIKALPDTSAEVYCNYTTRQEVSLAADGFVLMNGDVKVKMTISGTDAIFSTEMHRPQNVPDCLSQFYTKQNARFCGVGYYVPKGTAVIVRTVISKSE